MLQLFTFWNAFWLGTAPESDIISKGFIGSKFSRSSRKLAGWVQNSWCSPVQWGRWWLLWWRGRKRKEGKKVISSFLQKISPPLFSSCTNIYVWFGLINAFIIIFTLFILTSLFSCFFAFRVSLLSISATCASYLFVSVYRMILL